MSLNIKKIALFVGVILFLFLILIILIFFFSRIKIRPSPRVFVTPTEVPAAQQTKLSIRSVSPPEDVSREYFPVQEIQITFSIPIKIEDFHYEIDPPTETEVRYDGKSSYNLIMSPKTIWKPGITTITILTSTTSPYGQRLDKPFIYKLNTNLPKNPPPENPNYPPR